MNSSYHIDVGNCLQCGRQSAGFFQEIRRLRLVRVSHVITVPQQSPK